MPYRIVRVGYRMSEKATINSNTDTLSEQTARNCENCHSPVNGMYCSQCGQSVESTLKYFWTVILHLLDDIFSFDSRASRTLFPLLFKPGFLTLEYIAGRRIHYVPPLRLYLFVSIIFFISLKFFATSDGTSLIQIGNSNDNYTKINEHIALLTQQKQSASVEEIIVIEQQIKKFTTLKTDLANNKNLLLKGMSSELAELELIRLDENKELTEKQKSGMDSLQIKINKLKAGESIDLPGKGFNIGNTPDGSIEFEFLDKENNEKLTKFANLLAEKAEKAFKEDSAPLIREAIEKLPQLLFVLLPLFAALLKVMFIFSKRLYLEHLTVALHSHSFIFINILTLELLGLAQQQFGKVLPILADINDVLSVLLLAWIPIYLFLMQKRVYKQGYFLTTTKYCVIGLSYVFMIFITGTIAFIWGLAST